MTGPGYPGTAFRPRIVHQLRRDPSASWGNNFLGSNCGPSTDAMSADRATLGKIRRSGADMRELMGDHVGGTTLEQSRAALGKLGISLEVRTPGSFDSFENALYIGRGANLAGYYAPVQGTKYQGSETFTGNHRVWVNEGRGWSRDASGNWHAEEYLVFDPLADGRRSAIDDGPTWWPRDLVYAFAWRLDVSDPAEPYVPLGQGKAYFGLVRVTEPHVIRRYGGVASTPFPDRTRAKAKAAGGKVNVRGGPGSAYPLIRKLDDGEAWLAFQKTRGANAVDGVRTWHGNQDGTGWIVGSRLVGEGGAT